MPAPKDYYRVLGVAESAPAEEIKKAYRRLAKKYHPDVTGGDKAKEARFKEISEAYEVVGEEKKRTQYDAERRNPFAGMGGGGGRPGAGAGPDLSDLFNRVGREGGGFGDIFSEFFGGRTGRGATAKGIDMVARIDIDLPRAALGGEHTITVEGKRYTVKIPAGVEEGQTIRLTGKGGPGRGGPGDLLLEVHVRPHSQLRRHDHDLEVDVPISIEQAVLGGKADVTTLEGKVQLTIPPASSSGLKLRLRGKGVPRADGTRGDLYAVTQIMVPPAKDLSSKARELIAEFARLTKGG